MEFKEFTNPEENDYDIKSSLDGLDSFNNITSVNPYTMQLIDLIGILEDVTEQDLQEQYGISMNEYLHPTKETIDKVTEKVSRIHK